MTERSPVLGPHAFPAYSVGCWGIREFTVVHARTRSRAKAICVRSMIEAGFANDWPDALSQIECVFRCPEADGNELGHRIAPGEGYSHTNEATEL